MSGFRFNILFDFFSFFLFSSRFCRCLSSISCSFIIFHLYFYLSPYQGVHCLPYHIFFSFFYPSKAISNHIKVNYHHYVPSPSFPLFFLSLCLPDRKTTQLLSVAKNKRQLRLRRIIPLSALNRPNVYKQILPHLLTSTFYRISIAKSVYRSWYDEMNYQAIKG